MGEVINIRPSEWDEAFAIDGPGATLQLYVSADTGEAEIVQMDDAGKAIRSILTEQDVERLQAALEACKRRRARGADRVRKPVDP